MSVYIDTSALLPYYLPESLSESAERLLRSVPLPAISDLTEVELASALARKVRQGELAREAALHVKALFATHAQGGYFRRLRVSHGHFSLAKDWIGQLDLPLRTLDGLHLAIAALEELELVTADEGLARSAEALGIAFPATPGLGPQRRSVLGPSPVPGRPSRTGQARVALETQPQRFRNIGFPRAGCHETNPLRAKRRRVSASTWERIEKATGKGEAHGRLQDHRFRFLCCCSFRRPRATGTPGLCPRPRSSTRPMANLPSRSFPGSSKASSSSLKTK